MDPLTFADFIGLAQLGMAGVFIWWFYKGEIISAKTVDKIIKGTIAEIRGTLEEAAYKGSKKAHTESLRD